MKRLHKAARKIERSILLALLALPVLFSGLGAWEVWRSAAARAELAGLVDHHQDRIALLRDLERRGRTRDEARQPRPPADP